MLRLNRKTNVNGEPCAPRGARTVREGVGIPGLPHDLDVQVAKLRLLKSSFQSQRYMLEDNLARYFPREIAETKERIAALKSDIQTRDAHPTPSDSFVGIELDGIRYTERIAAGEALLNI